LTVPPFLNFFIGATTGFAATTGFGATGIGAGLGGTTGIDAGLGATMGIGAGLGAIDMVAGLGVTGAAIGFEYHRVSGGGGGSIGGPCRTGSFIPGCQYIVGGAIGVDISPSLRFLGATASFKMRARVIVPQTHPVFFNL